MDFDLDFEENYNGSAPLSQCDEDPGEMSTENDSDTADLGRLKNMLSASRPYAPWNSLADFEYTEMAVQGVMSKKIIDKQLRKLADSWTNEGGSKITMHNFRDYKRSLDKGRTLGVNFSQRTVAAELWGEQKTYTFCFRDPWQWILSLVTDPGLARVSEWQSRQLFYCENGHTERKPYYDYPPNPHMHCWLPLHIWLDKGLVTSHVKMFPIVLRALWLPSEIRNASGNGGGVIVGFMVMVLDPGNSEERTERQNYGFAQFKREIYQQVLEIIFESIWRKASTGELVECGDTVDRVLYPGFLIESLDFEEAWNFTCCRAGRAKHPCPRCLVSQDMLHCLQKSFPARNSSEMRAAIDRSRRAPNATQGEKILMDFGLHDIVAMTYDLVHFDESGKWAHHLWVLTLDLLKRLSLLTKATELMAEFPRWRNLKHINDLAAKDFSDGQTHLDILKCIIYILCELLPAKSPLIPCIRALLQCRMVLGLKVMTQSRKEVVERFIKNYEHWCKKVFEEHGKSFRFPKQHFLAHALEDVRLKGVLRNATTRTGEGTHQEVSQHFQQTNMRNAEAQITVRDEDQEAVARTRLIVYDFFKSNGDNPCPDDMEAESLEGFGRRILKSKLAPGSPANHWIFESPLRHGDSRSYKYLHGGNNPVYRAFDPRLRDFPHAQFPAEYFTYEDTIMVETFQCLYLSYQSREDWRNAEDILRCNSNWNKEGPRYDCIMFNSDEPGVACARLRSLIRCRLPSSRIVNLAVVNISKWRPKTVWDGCLVYEEGKEFSFLLLDYVIRGALLAPAHGARSTQQLRYLVDGVDGDMFLRILNAIEHVCY
ncbi:hypothetical protein R3P38DRAFT_3314735 [Favolaschia claudopus]|uniref:Transposase n=1 Tax=Favolaschia claudopus TaxID=2862362 RepID=A0AAW0BRF8_9AGAR